MLALSCCRKSYNKLYQQEFLSNSVRLSRIEEKHDHSDIDMNIFRPCLREKTMGKLDSLLINVNLDHFLNCDEKLINIVDIKYLCKTIQQSDVLGFDYVEKLNLHSIPTSEIFPIDISHILCRQTHFLQSLCNISVRVKYLSLKEIFNNGVKINLYEIKFLSINQSHRIEQDVLNSLVLQDSNHTTCSYDNRYRHEYINTLHIKDFSRDFTNVCIAQLTKCLLVKYNRLTDIDYLSHKWIDWNSSNQNRPIPLFTTPTYFNTDKHQNFFTVEVDISALNKECILLFSTPVGFTDMKSYIDCVMFDLESSIREGEDDDEYCDSILVRKGYSACNERHYMACGKFVRYQFGLGWTGSSPQITMYSLPLRAFLDHIVEDISFDNRSSHTKANIALHYTSSNRNSAISFLLRSSECKISYIPISLTHHQRLETHYSELCFSYIDRISYRNAVEWLNVFSLPILHAEKRKQLVSNIYKIPSNESRDNTSSFDRGLVFHHNCNENRRKPLELPAASNDDMPLFSSPFLIERRPTTEESVNIETYWRGLCISVHTLEDKPASDSSQEKEKVTVSVNDKIVLKSSSMKPICVSDSLLASTDCNDIKNDEVYHMKESPKSANDTTLCAVKTQDESHSGVNIESNVNVAQHVMSFLKEGFGGQLEDIYGKIHNACSDIKPERTNASCIVNICAHPQVHSNKKNVISTANRNSQSIVGEKSTLCSDNSEIEVNTTNDGKKSENLVRMPIVLSILISECILELYPDVIVDLNVNHNITCVDVSLEAPVSFLLDSYYSICLMDNTTFLNSSSLKQYVHQMTKLVWKYEMMCLIILCDDNQQNNYESVGGDTAMENPIASRLCCLLQSLSQFPCIVSVRLVSKKALANQIAAICLQSYDSIAKRMETSNDNIIFSFREYATRPNIAIIKSNNLLCAQCKFVHHVVSMCLCVYVYLCMYL